MRGASREWANDAGWVPIKKRDPSLVFRRMGISLFWDEQVEVVVRTDDGHVVASFIASGPCNRRGKGPPSLQEIADAFAEGVSAELEVCHATGTVCPSGAAGPGEEWTHTKTIRRLLRSAQYFVWALIPVWPVAAYLAGWSSYGITAVVGGIGTFMLALLVSQSSLGMRPRRHTPGYFFVIAGVLTVLLLGSAIANLPD